jgi:hypothetical protein
MIGPDANTQDTRSAVTTHPLLGVACVLLGALIATCTGRWMLCLVVVSFMSKVPTQYRQIIAVSAEVK